MKYPVFFLATTMSFLTTIAQQNNEVPRYPLASGVAMKTGTTSDEKGGSVNSHRTATLDLVPEKKQESSTLYYLSDTAVTRNKSYTKREVQK